MDFSIRNDHDVARSKEFIESEDQKSKKEQKLDKFKNEIISTESQKIKKKLEKTIKMKKRKSTERLDSSKEAGVIKKRSSSAPEKMQKGATKFERILKNKFYGTTEQRTADPEYRKTLERFWGMEGHEVQLETEDGKTLMGAFLFKPFTDEESKEAGYKAPSGKTIIYASGSFGTWEKYGKSLIPTLLKEGHQVLVFDYRGFGKNIDDEITMDGLKLDTEAVLHAALKLGIKLEDITFYGYSLGAALAADVASKYPVDLILDRPFTTSKSVIHDSAMFGVKNLAKNIISKFINISTIDALEKFKGQKISVVMGKDEMGSKKKYKKEFDKTLKKLTIENKDVIEIPELEHLDEKVHSKVKQIFSNENDEVKE